MAEGRSDAERHRARDRTAHWGRLWPPVQEVRRAADVRRPCQKEMLDDWWNILSGRHGRRHLLAHAPTGLGKTLAALVPALAWVAEDPNARCAYYLVNRVAQHANPMREVKRALAATFAMATGHDLRVVDLVGRDRLCINPGTPSLEQL